ncbi:MAG TPA: GDP-mannose 4,6-dehydratase [Candidatus Binatia bacterium]|nr:GDP-mannose 4,6-dehydratase [Candidatus Binatia bacterium]
MKVLITGIMGFIGSHLAETLVDDGDEVYGFVRRVASRKMDAIAKVLKDIVLITGDLTDYLSIRNAMRTAMPDVVIHLAALSPVRESFERPFEYQQANFLGTMNVAHALLELPDPKNRRIVAASTAEVYGLQNKQALTEDLPLKPSSPYAVTKVAGDLYLQMMFQTFNLHGSVMRATNSYGRKLDTSFLVEYLINQMLSDKEVYLGAPDSVRDYMYVDDHVNAYKLVMKSKKADGQVFNAGTGIGVTNKELSLLIAKKVGYNLGKIKFGSYPPGYPLRPLVSDQPSIILDATKIGKAVGWKPKVTLDEGLDRTIEYFRKLQTKDK